MLILSSAVLLFPILIAMARTANVSSTSFTLTSSQSVRSDAAMDVLPLKTLSLLTAITDATDFTSPVWVCFLQQSLHSDELEFVLSEMMRLKPRTFAAELVRVLHALYQYCNKDGHVFLKCDLVQYLLQPSYEVSNANLSLGSALYQQRLQSLLDSRCDVTRSSTSPSSSSVSSTLPSAPSSVSSSLPSDSFVELLELVFPSTTLGCMLFYLDDVTADTIHTLQDHRVWRMAAFARLRTLQYSSMIGIQRPDYAWTRAHVLLLNPLMATAIVENRGDLLAKWMQAIKNSKRELVEYALDLLRSLRRSSFKLVLGNPLVEAFIAERLYPHKSILQLSAELQAMPSSCQLAMFHQTFPPPLMGIEGILSVDPINVYEGYSSRLTPMNPEMPNFSAVGMNWMGRCATLTFDLRNGTTFSVATPVMMQVSHIPMDTVVVLSPSSYSALYLPPSTVSASNSSSLPSSSTLAVSLLSSSASSSPSLSTPTASSSCPASIFVSALHYDDKGRNPTYALRESGRYVVLVFARSLHVTAALDGANSLSERQLLDLSRSLQATCIAVHLFHADS